MYEGQASSRQPEGAKSKRRNLSKEPQRYYVAILILCIYLSVALAGWVLICLLSRRPISFQSYYSQSGEFTLEQYGINDRWRRASALLQNITATLTLPVTTAIISQAAVVYVYRNPNLSLRQTLALADKGWSDLAILSNCITPRLAPLIWTPFLQLAFLLLILGLIVQPLQQLLVKTETMDVVTAELSSGVSSIPDNVDTWITRPASLRIIGKEPGLNQLDTVPISVVVGDVTAKTIYGQGRDSQPYLWANSTRNSSDIYQGGTKYRAKGVGDSLLADNLLDNLSLRRLANDGFLETPFFVSTFPNGTSTGVLRVHALALKTDLKCEFIPREEFPSSCSGDFPFTSEYEYNTEERETWTYTSVRVCVPGDYRVSPWSKIRDRQTIFEDLYIDVTWNSYADSESMVNFTRHCIGRTSRGYFELPNRWNGYAPGAMLDKWPSEEAVKTDFNDLSGVVKSMTVDNITYEDTGLDGMVPWDMGGGSCYVPHDQYADAETGCSYSTPGPLMTSALSIFGRGTFFDTVRLYNSGSNMSNASRGTLKRACEDLHYPFDGFGFFVQYASWYCDEINYTLRDAMNRMLEQWIQYLSPNSSMSDNVDRGIYNAMGAATFYANVDTLTKAATGSFQHMDSRPVFTTEGETIQRYTMSTGAMVGISILLGLHMAGLCLLTGYAFYTSVWTRTLDAFAVLRIGQRVQLGLPDLHATDSNRVDNLDRLDTKGDKLLT